MMKRQKTLIATALALGGALAATQASAQAFVGGGFGKSDIDEEITTGLITSGTVDGKDTFPIRKGNAATLIADGDGGWQLIGTVA